MRNVKIIDDAISKGYQDWIEDVMSGTDFPWYFNGKGITSETNPGDLATGFFHHILKDGVSSNHFQMLIPLLFENVNSYVNIIPFMVFKFSFNYYFFDLSIQSRIISSFIVSEL